MSSIQAKSVSWLLNQIGTTLRNEQTLHGVILEGEISNFHAHSSGHWYFSLKDANARIDATMWRNDNRMMSFVPRDGDKVRVKGDVAVYAVQGKLQFTVKLMAKAGAGDLKAQFDALYKKLSEEGLFNPVHKKPIPSYAMRIGLVTGKGTHARADVYNTLLRRWPAAQVQDYDALVQGEAAAGTIISALLTADQGNHDVILLCRGGGSMEDLWCFNDEALVRTIYRMKTPVITGIGHEPDWTMADYVADLRAPTPTGAAELSTPDIHKVKAQLEEFRHQLVYHMHNRMEEERETLDALSSSEVFTDPFSMIRDKVMHKDLLEQRFLRLLQEGSHVFQTQVNEHRRALITSMQASLNESHIRLELDQERLNQSVGRSLEAKKQILRSAAGLLDAYSPLKVLVRGYSVTSTNGHVINSVESLHVSDTIHVRLSDGSLEASVTDIHTKE